MANYFYVTLDTIGPANPTLTLDGGAIYTATQLLDAAIGTTDGDTTGYQMKIWGNVDLAHTAEIQDTEGASGWLTYQATKQIKLSSTEGSKTVRLKIRDNVYNESSEVTDTIILDTSMPVGTIVGPDVSIISEKAGKGTLAFSFQVNEAFVEYKVKVVGAPGAAHDTGTLIPMAAGSTNMSAVGVFPAGTPINSQIKGTDLKAASAGDSQKCVKLFVKDTSGNWSV